jgi:hypothetical protein
VNDRRGERERDREAQKPVIFMRFTGEEKDWLFPMWVWLIGMVKRNGGIITLDHAVFREKS